jgi:hypothetical protein
MSDEFAEFDGYDPSPAELPPDGPDDISDDGTADTDEQLDRPDAPQQEPEQDRIGEGEPPTTGNSRVDAATALLADLDEQPTSEHAEVFDEVHRQLQGALADLDGD